MAQVIHAFQVEKLELIDGKYIAPHRAFMGSVIPDWLFIIPESKISIGAKACYARLCRYAGKSHECFPRQAQIAENMGCSERTIKRRIEELAKYKLIEKYKTGKGNQVGYRILYHEWMDGKVDKKADVNMDKNERQTRRNNSTQKCQIRTSKSDRSAHLKVSDSHFKSDRSALQKCQIRTLKGTDPHFLYKDEVNQEENQIRESIKSKRLFPKSGSDSRKPNSAPLPSAPSAISSFVEIQKTSSQHFSKQVGDFFESIKKNCDQITGLCKATGKKFNPYQWVQQKVNRKGHPGAIDESLAGLTSFWGDIDKPWAYIDAIFKTKNGNWNEKDAIRIHEEMKKLTGEELLGITRGLFERI